MEAGGSGVVDEVLLTTLAVVVVVVALVVAAGLEDLRVAASVVCAVVVVVLGVVVAGGVVGVVVSGSYVGKDGLNGAGAVVAVLVLDGAAVADGVEAAGAEVAMTDEVTLAYHRNRDSTTVALKTTSCQVLLPKDHLTVTAFCMICCLCVTPLLLQDCLRMGIKSKKAPTAGYWSGNLAERACSRNPLIKRFCLPWMVTARTSWPR